METMNAITTQQPIPYPLDVVVIDDEETFTEGCRQTLEMGGYHTAVARNGNQGLDLVRAADPSVVLVDLRMPGMNGLEVLTHLATAAPSAVAIVVTGHGTVDSAVESMKVGAFDLLTKPFEPEKLLESVRRGMSLSVLRKAAKKPPSKKEMDTARVAPQNKNDIVLRGLGVLGEAYSLGLDKRELLDELSYLESEAKYHAESLGQIKRKERAILDIRNELLDADSIMEKYDFQKGALIQVLLDVQEKLHWIPRHIIHWIAVRLNVAPAEIHTIVNFYEAFSLEPRGRHCVQVCTGTACHVRGAQEMLLRVSAVLGIQAGQTDSQQQFTLETVHCLGCCALAPVVQIDKDYYHQPSKNRLARIVKSLDQDKEEAIPCRH
jgi:NADH-quinone oxidoreductase subunit E